MFQRKGVLETVFIAFLIGMIVLWFLYPGLITTFFPELVHTDRTDKGIFGDMFGSFNALISGLAFAGIVYTILMQRQELGLQREELRLTREELERQTDAQEQTSKSFSEQLKEMQEQNELQLRPFVIIKYKEEPRFANASLCIINVGNSTAINIRIYNVTKQHNIDFYASTLEKSEAVALGGPTSKPEYLYDDDLIVKFQNMKKKDYYVVESILRDTHEIKEFDEGIYELSTSSNS